MAAGKDVNLRCGPLEIPVMLTAALVGRVKISRDVIEYGAAVDAVDRNLHPALDFALSSNNLEVIQVLFLGARGQHRSTRSSGLHTSPVAYWNMARPTTSRPTISIRENTVDVCSSESRNSRSCGGCGFSVEGRCG